MSFHKPIFQNYDTLKFTYIFQKRSEKRNVKSLKARIKYRQVSTIVDIIFLFFPKKQNVKQQQIPIFHFLYVKFQ